MNKYILLFCFIISINLSNEIEKEELEKYYDYVTIIIDGMANKGKGKGKCAEHMIKYRNDLIEAIMDIIEEDGKSEKIEDIINIILKHLGLIKLYNLQVNCNISTLQQLMTDLENKNKFEETIIEIGKALYGIIDYSVN